MYRLVLLGSWSFSIRALNDALSETEPIGKEAVEAVSSSQGSEEALNEGRGTPFERTGVYAAPGIL